MLCHETCHVNRFDCKDKMFVYYDMHTIKYNTIDRNNIIDDADNQWHHEPVKEKRRKSNLTIAKRTYIFSLLYILNVFPALYRLPITI